MDGDLIGFDGVFPCGDLVCACAQPEAKSGRWICVVVAFNDFVESCIDFDRSWPFSGAGFLFLFFLGFDRVFYIDFCVFLVG